MLNELYIFIERIDFDILYAIQQLRCGFLDGFFKAVTGIAGNWGHIWIILGVLLLIFRKTRACGAAVLVSYGLVFLAGQLVLKDLIARPRPCHIDEAVRLIIDRPSSFSCPSTHTAWAFGAVAAVFAFSKKWGSVTLIPALIIAFSRLYLFVHFPTDVLFGVVLGALCGIVSALIVKALQKRFVSAGKTGKNP